MSPPLDPSFVPVPSKRVKPGGGPRWILLLLALGSTVAMLAGVFSVAAGQQDDALGPSALPRRVLMLSLCGLLDVGFSAGVWGWRRWGVFGIVIVSLFGFMLNFRIGGIAMAVPSLIGPGLLTVFAGIYWGEFD
jgi:hypothetical protein